MTTINSTYKYHPRNPVTQPMPLTNLVPAMKHVKVTTSKCTWSLECPAYVTLYTKIEKLNIYYYNRMAILSPQFPLAEHMNRKQLDYYRQFRQDCRCCQCDFECEPCFDARMKNTVIQLILKQLKSEPAGQYRNNLLAELQLVRNIQKYQYHTI
jgi:hypothetical protein